MTDFVRIFDTTLRDGEQSPGNTMDAVQKLKMALQLEKLGVDVIEVGFAAASDDELKAVTSISKALTQPVVLSLARTRIYDLEKALKAVVGKAKHPGLHTFIATSDLHLKRKLRMSRQQALDEACKAVVFAKQYVDHVEFSAEDASRSDHGYLARIFSEVIRVGATVINVPDTTGYAVPEEFAKLIRYLIKNTDGAEQVIWSAHCHNDMGAAVDNSLAAIMAGARQIECTVNGIGERAGNASLEEIVMRLETRHDYYGLQTGVLTTEITPTSRLLVHLTGNEVSPHKPIVGDGVFSHEAGIHVDGVLKDRATYEIMKPADVGRKSNKLVLGKHSGKSGLDNELRKIGVDIERLDLNLAYELFTRLADQKSDIYEEDLLAIVDQATPSGEEYYRLLYVHLTSSSNATPYAMAVVRVQIGKDEIKARATGDGMVNAVISAIKSATGVEAEIARWIPKAIGPGSAAQGRVGCVVRQRGKAAPGCYTHTDVVMCTAYAFTRALNRLREINGSSADLKEAVRAV